MDNEIKISKNRREFIEGNVYHVLNRGVDKRTIFMDKRDYSRFMYDLFEFNDITRPPKYSDIASPITNPVTTEHKKRSLLVEVLSFVLMPNHYHLLLLQKTENGIPLFMKKLNMGYAKYFNDKYKRKGALFEGRYKSIEVTNEPHFLWLPYYIHCNPLDFIFPQWRKGEIKNSKEALIFLESYRWSSHLDYIGVKNFPLVTQRKFLIDIFGSTQNYKTQFEQWLKDMELEIKKEFFLE